MSLELNNCPSCLSLVRVDSEIQYIQYIENNKKESLPSTVDEFAFKGGVRGGIVGGVVAGGYALVATVAAPIMASAILGAMGLGYLGIFKGVWEYDEVYENQSKKVDYISSIREIEKMGLKLIFEAIQEAGVIDGDRIDRIDRLENDFINAIKNNHIVENWSTGSFVLNPKFGECIFDPALRARLNLVFLNAIAIIRGGKTSVTSTCHAFESTIYDMERNYLSDIELICFSRYRLGKCYLKIREIEKAREQFNKIICLFNGSNNDSLRNDTRRELQFLMI